MTQEVVQDRNALKIQALLQRTSGQAANYENQIADLLVANTLLTNEVEALHARISELEEPTEDVSEAEDRPKKSKSGS